MDLPRVAFGKGFVNKSIRAGNSQGIPVYPVDVSNGMPVVSEKKYKTQVSKIGGKKIKEKKGKLSDDLGKPAMQASEKDLQSYVDAASGKEKQKRVARVNLMKAHKKGHKAQGNKIK